MATFQDDDQSDVLAMLEGLEEALQEVADAEPDAPAPRGSSASLAPTVTVAASGSKPLAKLPVVPPLSNRFPTASAILAGTEEAAPSVLRTVLSSPPAALPQGPGSGPAVSPFATARTAHRDPPPRTHGYTSTRGATREVLASFPWEASKP